MMISRSGALTALSVVLFLAGCAGNAADTDAAGDSSTPPATTAPAVAPSASGVPKLPPGGTKPSAGAVQTLKGEVIAGVEPGCLVLTNAQGSHLLVLRGDLDTTVKVGETITVTGRADPGMATTCQQGTPFVVAAVDAG